MDLHLINTLSKVQRLSEVLYRRQSCVSRHVLHIDIIYWFDFGIINVVRCTCMAHHIHAFSHQVPINCSGVESLTWCGIWQEPTRNPSPIRGASLIHLFFYICQCMQVRVLVSSNTKNRFRRATNLLHDIMSNVSSILPICVAATHCRKPSRQGHWCNTRRSLRAHVKRQLHQNETYETDLTPNARPIKCYQRPSDTAVKTGAT